MPSTRILAVIPARGGSKGLPRKNILSFNGRPLLAYSIEAAQRCPLVDRCVVTTEDAEIKATALAYGAEVIDRPSAFSTDSARTHEAARHVLETVRSDGPLPEILVLLQPTSPLRTAAHLTECLETFLASEATCAISVTEAEHHPYKTFLLEGGRLLPLFNAESIEMPRQSLPAVYRPNGAIFAIYSRVFLDTGNFYTPPALAYRMPADASVDIDTAFDFSMAERIAAEQR